MKCVDLSDPLQQLTGIFFTDSTLGYVKRIILLQIPFITLVQGIFQFVLKPFGETPFVAQILGGIVVGPTALSQIPKFKSSVFPAESFYLTDTLGYYGCMFYLFLIGVKMDLSIVKKSSTKERVIGILTFGIPMLFTMGMSFLVKKSTTMEDSVPMIALLGSTTSFHSIACFLADLNILNTELGRLATSASTISGICSWITIEIAFFTQENRNLEVTRLLDFTVSTFTVVMFITIVLRKIVIWIIRRTPQDEQVKEIHLMAIFLMILGTAFIGECLGQHFTFGPMIFGLVIPDGPPVGSALVDKLDGTISGLLLPLYFFNIGSKVTLKKKDFTFTRFVIFLLPSLGFMGKLVGTIVPCLYYQVPFRDAFTLGLILSTIGVFDLQFYNTGMQYIGIEAFSCMVVIALVLTGVIAPLVRYLYKPSKTYLGQKKRSIQNAKRNVELPILVCIYNEVNVPTILNILEASNPTRESPIVVYVLHLVELLGRSTPLLIAHKPHEKNFDKATASDHIINSFQIYEKRNHGVVFVQPFTAITPVVTAHDDICTLAIDKQTFLIIIPFHKQWNIDGTTQSSKWRNTNRKVLDSASCTVGLLIDRGQLSTAMSFISSLSSYTVGVIFLGGADDREAMYYAMRIVEQANIHLTVRRIIPINNVISNVVEKRLDSDVINAYRLANKGSERNTYKENIVRDGVEIVSLIRDIQSAYHLILVGRRHYNYSTILSAFNEWNEYPELGFFGDMFASSDFKGNTSVLVMQHSSTPTDVMIDAQELGTYSENGM